MAARLIFKFSGTLHSVARQPHKSQGNLNFVGVILSHSQVQEQGANEITPAVVGLAGRCGHLGLETVHAVK